MILVIYFRWETLKQLLNGSCSIRTTHYVETSSQVQERGSQDNPASSWEAGMTAISDQSNNKRQKIVLNTINRQCTFKRNTRKRKANNSLVI